ncbi:hypothetical protein GCM10027592_63210 [Spirosoma flavus]
METYSVQIVRKAGKNPITGEVITEESETLPIEAASVEDAYRWGNILHTLPMRGAEVEVYINGQLVKGRF